MISIFSSQISQKKTSSFQLEGEVTNFEQANHQGINKITRNSRKPPSKNIQATFE